MIANPAIDYAKLAQAQGVWGEGPIDRPGEARPALKRGRVVRKGSPALLGVVRQGR